MYEDKNEKLLSSYRGSEDILANKIYDPYMSGNIELAE